MEWETVGLADWWRIQAVDVESVLLPAQAFTPGTRERGFGRIVLITSDTVWRPPRPDLRGYITSKGALTAFGRTLAAAPGKDGIAVTSVAPGLTRTPATAYQPDDAFDAALATQALPRPLVRDDVAATVGFLAGDAAEELTGQVLTVDGGSLLR
ncbi:SDR family NAD(P)-dependent oxidoreductase [Streptomyces sp. NPDC001100]